MLELSLTRLFSATMYYHFAFMAISVALFGSGVSGVFVYAFRDRLNEERTGKYLTISSLLFAFTVIFALYVILEFPLVLSDRSENYFRLLIIYAATSLPFFTAGCAVTLSITRFAKDISRLYLFDLAGAALGCLLLIPVLNYLGAINVVIFIASIGTLSAILFTFVQKQSVALRLAVVAVAAGSFTLLGLNLSFAFFEIQSSKGYKEEKLLFSKWNSFSRITVDGDLDDELSIKIDSDAATLIAKDWREKDVQERLKNDISALAYNLKPESRVAIIGPGGGLDVATAIAFGAKSITAVEINPIIAEDVMLREPFKSHSGDIYGQPNVSLIVDEGRSFIRRTDESYDILQGTMVDTWAATAAGAFSLSENNLYTVEAFRDYASHLSADGILTMTRWYFEPPDQLLRLISLSRAMMADLEIENPDRHFILIRDRFTNPDRTPASFLFKKSEFTDEEVRKIESISKENNFEILYTPLTRPDNVFTQMIEAKDPAALWNSLEYNVAPTYDNNPFFFNSLRLKNLSKAFGHGAAEWRKSNLGTFVLFALLGITGVLVLLFILLPLMLIRNPAIKGKSRLSTPYVLYFGCLGAGFIIVEIAMIQKFILFLGHPVYALAVILFSLLTFSAIGSYLSGKFADKSLRKLIIRVIFAIVVLSLIYILVLPSIFYGLVALQLWIRILISVLLMAPLALLMGMPMPAGIKLVSERYPSIIPWAWGVNGAASVMGSVAALAIAILTGFNEAILAGSGIYLVGAMMIAFAESGRRSQ